MPTIKAWLAAQTERFLKKNLSSARLDAELILSHVTNKSRTELLAHPDTLLTSTQTEQANALAARRAHFEPMAFILGHREFFGIDFKTDERALIPRGESECLIETALTWLNEQKTPQEVAEIGTGSGVLILTLAKLAPQHHYVATEISPEALALAQENATLLGLDSVKFIEGNLAEPLLTRDKKFNLIIANLPYIPSGLLVNLDPTVRYFEPNVALEGGETGLELYAQFLPQAAERLAPGGLLLCEHDYDQGPAMHNLVKKSFSTAKIVTLKDSLGHDRVTSVRLT